MILQKILVMFQYHLDVIVFGKSMASDSLQDMDTILLNSKRPTAITLKVRCVYFVLEIPFKNCITHLIGPIALSTSTEH